MIAATLQRQIGALRRPGTREMPKPVRTSRVSRKTSQDTYRSSGALHAPAGQRSALRVLRAAAEGSAAATSSKVAELTDSLRLLETERDDAVKTAESCARTCVRLEEMLSLLDRMALERMRDGNEAAARSALQEKAEARAVLDRTNARAKVNYELASKLAEKIGTVQRQLMDLLSPAGTSAAGAAAGAPAAAEPPVAAAAAAPSAPPMQEESRGSSSSSSSSGSGSTSSSSGFAGADFSPFGEGYRPRQPAWEASLEAARERIRAAEATAAAAGAAAAAEGRAAGRRARETIEEARERLRQQALESVAEAQQRVRVKANESIAEARARIAAEDDAVLQKVQALMARYRRGEYVTEDELEWAFRQLERRFLI